MENDRLIGQDSPAESEVTSAETEVKKSGTRKKATTKPNKEACTAPTTDANNEGEVKKPARKPRKQSVPKTDGEVNLPKDDVPCKAEDEMMGGITESEEVKSECGSNENAATVKSEVDVNADTLDVKPEEDGESCSVDGAKPEKTEVTTEESPTGDEKFLKEETSLPPYPQKSIDAESDILTPDELFSNIQLVAEASESDGSRPESTYEEIVDEDGQYTFAEITYEQEDDVPEYAPELPDVSTYNPKKPRHIDNIFDFVELCVFTLLAVIVIISFFFKHSVVDGASMQNTLENGEHLIISDLFYTPKRGDIIVCEDHTTAISRPIVKRVIAVAGDTVEITEEGIVYVNGTPLDESKYVYIDDLFYRYTYGIWTVGEGQLFVMGDHRNNSTDSRVLGTVSVDSVLGKVLFRFYPFDKFGKVD